MDEIVKPKTALKVVFGAMNLGREGGMAVKVFDHDVCNAMLDTFQSHGHKEIDAGRIYGGGSTELLLGQLKWQDRGLSMNTKLIPLKRGPFNYSHTKDGVKTGMMESLKALGTDKVDLWSLHKPDHETPYEETLEAVNELYKAGHFKRLGISSYSAWEVAQICEICTRHGWKKPDVFLGFYNALQRNVETELFACLRHYGISFYMFCVLEKGLLTDREQKEPTGVKKMAMNGVKHDNPAQAEAVNTIIKPAAQKLGIPTAEAAVRWASHHSKLRGDLGDAVIVGASSVEQLEKNLECFEKGPLPEEMVKAFDDAWLLTKASAGTYFL